MISRFTFILLLGILCLSSCSTFYNRKYTKGFYNDLGFRHKSAMPENMSRTTGILQKPKPEPTSVANEPLAEKTSVAPESSFVSPAKEHPITFAAITTKEKGQEFFKITKSREKSHSKPLFLKKKLAPIISNDGDTGTFLLYILAFILAIAIIVLAFYFVPAVIIPAIATEKVLEILAIIICTLVFAICAAIYTLISNFIDFIRRKKTGSGKFYY